MESFGALDDVDVLALFHFSPPVVSAALAVAEREQASGADLVAAMNAAGCPVVAVDIAPAKLEWALRLGAENGDRDTPPVGVVDAVDARRRSMAQSGRLRDRPHLWIVAHHRPSQTLVAGAQ